MQSWPDPLVVLTGGHSPEQDRQIRRIFAHRLHLVSELHGAGGRPAVGTDTGTGYLVPRFALHGELVLLVAAGLTSREALRAATQDAAARALGPPALPACLPACLPAVGTVAREQVADLLSSTPTLCETSATPAVSTAWS
ncbi:hypothetical protein ABZT06_20725 [Streptomyces sp. NPDC005483]|uniref:hypothetical protein n=1 Tax=Streptomyces sp. NPDC005483 TaxID=3154882 RepID=UPI0033AA2A0E